MGIQQGLTYVLDFDLGHSGSDLCDGGVTRDMTFQKLPF